MRRDTVIVTQSVTNRLNASVTSEGRYKKAKMTNISSKKNNGADIMSNLIFSLETKTWVKVHLKIIFLIHISIIKIITKTKRI